MTDCVAPTDCMVLACDVAVRRALELSSKRLLGRRAHGFQFADVAPWLMYTKLPAVIEPAEQVKVLHGAWTCLPEPLVDVPGLVPALDGYVRSLLESGTEHTPEYLWPVVRGVLDG